MEFEVHPAERILRGEDWPVRRGGDGTTRIPADDLRRGGGLALLSPTTLAMPTTVAREGDPPTTTAICGGHDPGARRCLAATARMWVVHQPSRGLLVTATPAATIPFAVPDAPFVSGAVVGLGLDDEVLHIASAQAANNTVRVCLTMARMVGATPSVRGLATEQITVPQVGAGAPKVIYATAHGTTRSTVVWNAAAARFSSNGGLIAVVPEAGAGAPPLVVYRVASARADADTAGDDDGDTHGVAILRDSDLYRKGNRACRAEPLCREWNGLPAGARVKDISFIRRGMSNEWAVVAVGDGWLRVLDPLAGGRAVYAWEVDAELMPATLLLGCGTEHDANEDGNGGSGGGRDSVCVGVVRTAGDVDTLDVEVYSLRAKDPRLAIADALAADDVERAEAIAAQTITGATPPREAVWVIAWDHSTRTAADVARCFPNLSAAAIHELCIRPALPRELDTFFAMLRNLETALRVATATAGEGDARHCFVDSILMCLTAAALLSGEGKGEKAPAPPNVGDASDEPKRVVKLVSCKRGLRQWWRRLCAAIDRGTGRVKREVMEGLAREMSSRRCTRELSILLTIGCVSHTPLADDADTVRRVLGDLPPSTSCSDARAVLPSRGMRHSLHIPTQRVSPSITVERWPIPVLTAALADEVALAMAYKTSWYGLVTHMTSWVADTTDAALQRDAAGLHAVVTAASRHAQCLLFGDAPPSLEVYRGRDARAKLVGELVAAAAPQNAGAAPPAFAERWGLPRIVELREAAGYTDAMAGAVEKLCAWAVEVAEARAGRERGDITAAAAFAQLPLARGTLRELVVHAVRSGGVDVRDDAADTAGAGAGAAAGGSSSPSGTAASVNPLGATTGSRTLDYMLGKTFDMQTKLVNNAEGIARSLVTQAARRAASPSAGAVDGKALGRGVWAAVVDDVLDVAPGWIDAGSEASIDELREVVLEALVAARCGLAAKEYATTTAKDGGVRGVGAALTRAIRDALGAAESMADAPAIAGAAAAVEIWDELLADGAFDDVADYTTFARDFNVLCEKVYLAQEVAGKYPQAATHLRPLEPSNLITTILSHAATARGQPPALDPLLSLARRGGLGSEPALAAIIEHAVAHNDVALAVDACRQVRTHDETGDADVSGDNATLPAFMLLQNVASHFGASLSTSEWAALQARLIAAAPPSRVAECLEAYYTAPQVAKGIGAKAAASLTAGADAAAPGFDGMKPDTGADDDALDGSGDGDGWAVDGAMDDDMDVDADGSAAAPAPSAAEGRGDVAGKPRTWVEGGLAGLSYSGLQSTVGQGGTLLWGAARGIGELGKGLSTLDAAALMNNLNLRSGSGAGSAQDDAVHNALVAQSYTRGQGVVDAAAAVVFEGERMRARAAVARATQQLLEEERAERDGIARTRVADAAPFTVLHEEMTERGTLAASAAVASLGIDEVVARSGIELAEGGDVRATMRPAVDTLHLLQEESAARRGLEATTAAEQQADVVPYYVENCLVPLEGLQREAVAAECEAVFESMAQSEASSIDAYLARIEREEAVARRAIADDEAAVRCVLPTAEIDEPRCRRAIESELLASWIEAAPSWESQTRRVWQAGVKLGYRQIAVVKQEGLARAEIDAAEAAAAVAIVDGCASGSTTLARDTIIDAAELWMGAFIPAEETQAFTEIAMRCAVEVGALGAAAAMVLESARGGVVVAEALQRRALCGEADHASAGIREDWLHGLSLHAQQGEARARHAADEQAARSAIQKDVIAFYKTVRTAMVDSHAGARDATQQRLRRSLALSQELQKVPTLEAHLRRQIEAGEAAARAELAQACERAKFVAQAASVAGPRGDGSSTDVAARLRSCVRGLLESGRCEDVYGFNRGAWEAVLAEVPREGLTVDLVELSLGVVHAAHAAASECGVDQCQAGTTFSVACAWLLKSVYRIPYDPPLKVKVVLFHRYLHSFATLLRDIFSELPPAGATVAADHVHTAVQLAEGAAVAFGVVFEDSLPSSS